MKDPKKLRKQRPDYVSDPNATGDPDREPMIGGDPEDVPPPAEHEATEAEDEANGGRRDGG